MSGVTEKTTGQEIIAPPPVDRDNVLHRSRGETPVVRDAGTREGTQGAPAGCLFELAPAGGGLRSHTPVLPSNKTGCRTACAGAGTLPPTQTPGRVTLQCRGPPKRWGDPKKGERSGSPFSGGCFLTPPSLFLASFQPAPAPLPPSAAPRSHPRSVRARHEGASTGGEAGDAPGRGVSRGYGGPPRRPPSRTKTLRPRRPPPRHPHFPLSTRPCRRAAFHRGAGRARRAATGAGDAVRALCRSFAFCRLRISTPFRAPPPTPRPRPPSPPKPPVRKTMG